MGHDNQGGEFRIFLGGAEVKGIAELPEINCISADAAELPQEIASFSDAEFTIELKPPKRWRCRSRKRFIKLMMGDGIQRNEAVRMADFMRASVSYRDAWHHYLMSVGWREKT